MQKRTVLGLLGEDQPPGDVHEWNVNNIFRNKGVESREAAKTFFFSWLYNPDSTKIEESFYDRDALLKEYYQDGHIRTIFDRKIDVNEYKAVNYIVQSTTADLVNDRAVAIDRLEDKRSFVSHIVHDEIVLDMPDEERYLIPEIKEIFSNNKLDKFVTNLKAGKDYMDIEFKSMISVVGIGNAASSIVENFKTQKNNYKVYQLGSNQKTLNIQRS